MNYENIVTTVPIEYNHATLIWIKCFYNDRRQSFYFDKQLIVDTRLPMKLIKKIVKYYANKAIDEMIEENPYMVECFASYKSYYTRYFITDDELNLRLLELTF